MTKPRLVIVSTFDDLCGIAGYTRCLMKQLENDFEVDVFDLDQFFMRSTNRKIKLVADDIIKAFCEKAKTYDFVNIQFEHGIFGRNKSEFLPRFRWIAEAAPALSVTFHTVLPEDPLDSSQVLEDLSRLRIYDAWSVVRNHRERKAINRYLFGVIREQSAKKPVHTIVHTRREMMFLRNIHGLPSVIDHPLAFFPQETVSRLKTEATRDQFPLLENLPADTKLIGVFGFLSEYKGFETVVRALQFLPDKYHLLFFGGVHPNEIKKQQKIDPYIRKLLDVAYIDSSALDVLGDRKASVSLDFDGLTKLSRHPNYVGHRIHFMGSQSDEGFARGMCICDHVVLPYIEVGQSASGPMSIALEMGARVIAARNRAFMQFARYNPNTIEFFEIGNHLELAERIRSRPEFPVDSRTIPYNTETNRAVYRTANGR